MIVLTYEVELLEPCLVTSLQGDPNSAVSFDYLPGSVLRGALIDRYLWQQREQDKGYQLDVLADEVRDMFFNGRTRYLNAYPLQNKQRSLPIPLSWQVEKHHEDEDIYDFAAEDATESYPDKEWKGVNRPFVLVDDDQAYMVETERYIAIHIARDRHPNRESDREPERAVYRYDALAAGQIFAAAIICPDQTAADTLAQLLPDILSLGGSRTGGYGRVTVKNIQTQPQCRELPGQIHANSGFLTVTLLSDALIRDENGQLAANATAVTRHLSTRLNCSLDLERAYYQTTAIGGFNRKWGLPLPQATALQMGSVFVFQTADCSREALQSLEAEGVGERRVDGFGSVGLNWHTEATLSQPEVKPTAEVTAVALDPTTSSGKTAQDIANQLFRQKLKALLDEQANTIGPSIRGMKKSQLHALRQAVHSALLQDTSQAGHETLNRYLQYALKRRVSREQLEKARVEGRNMSTWLENRLKDMQTEVGQEEKREIWQKYLKVSTLPQIGGIQAERTAQMGFEYNLRLIEAVIARATKVTSGGTQNE